MTVYCPLNNACLPALNVFITTRYDSHAQIQYRSFGITWPAVKGVDLGCMCLGCPDIPNVRMGTPNGTLAPPKDPLAQGEAHSEGYAISGIQQGGCSSSPDGPLSFAESSSKWTLVALAGSRPQERTIMHNRGHTAWKDLWFPKWVPRSRERASKAHKRPAVHNNGSSSMEGSLNCRAQYFRVGSLGARWALFGKHETLPRCMAPVVHDGFLPSSYPHPC